MAFYSFEERWKLYRDMGLPIPIKTEAEANGKTECPKNPNNLKFFLVHCNENENVTVGIMVCNESENQPRIAPSISVAAMEQIDVEKASKLTGVAEW